MNSSAARPILETNAICPVCGGRFKFLYTIERLNPPLQIVVCPGCGLQRQNDIPSDPAHLYDENYYTGDTGYTYRDERKKIEFDNYVWKARLNKIAEFVPPPADFLDIGCAFGGFLQAAGDAGYRAQGLDISQYAVDECRKRGLDVRKGQIAPGVFKNSSLDVVTMVEVFEHLTDPESAMTALRDIIRPGGLLLIQTANFSGLQAAFAGADYNYYLAGHFYYYSTVNLRLLFKKFGFSRIHFYRGVDFGLLPKLQKSRGDFQSWKDYLRWFRIAWYHMKSKIALGDFALTSSMTAYAFRDQG